MKIAMLMIVFLPLCLAVGAMSITGASDDDSASPSLEDSPRNLPVEMPAIRCSLVPEKDGGAIQSLVFSLDGKTLLAGNDHGVVQWFDPATGRKKISCRVSPHNLGGCGGLAISANGPSIATQTEQNEVSLLDAVTGRHRLMLEEIPPKKQVFLRGIAFSPNGDLVAGGYTSGEVVIWDAATGRRRHILPPHFLPDHFSARFQRVLPGEPAHISNLAFTPDGKSLVSLGGVVRIWDAASGTERARFDPNQKSDWWRLALSPDGNTLALIQNTGDPLTSYKGEIVLWDRSTKRRVAQWPIGGSGQDLAFLPDGKTLVSLEEVPIVRLWDVATGKQRDAVRFDRHTHLSTLAVSPDGKRIALGGYESNHIFGVINLLETDGATLQPWKPEP